MKANESKVTKILLLVMSMGLFLVVGYYKVTRDLPSVYETRLIIYMLSYLVIAGIAARLLLTGKEKHNYPEFKKISLYNEAGAAIKIKSSWHEVSGKTKIRVKFRGKAEKICFFITPKGYRTTHLREHIGTLCLGNPDAAEEAFGRDNMAEFIWDVPTEEFKGHLGVEIIDKDKACYMPRAINVTNEGSFEKGAQS